MKNVTILQSCFVGGNALAAGSQVKLDDKDAKTLITMGRAQVTKKVSKPEKPAQHSSEPDKPENTNG